MKKYLILISLFMVLSTMTAQETYRSVFGEKTTSFNITETMIDGVDITNLFYYVQDTNLNNILYKEFFREWLHLPEIDMDNSNYIRTSFLLRESDDHSKVFLRILNGEGDYWVDDESREYLVMDLNLNVQDTFIIRTSPDYNPDSALLIVTDVFFDDEGRKHIQFDENVLYTSLPFEFIEGIGTNMGLFYMGGGIFHFANYGPTINCILCVFQDDNHIFTYVDSPWYSYVKYCSASLETNKLEQESLTLYPNPSSGMVTIDLGENMQQFCEIEIYNMIGQLLYAATITGNRFDIDISSLGSGGYIARIISKEKISICKPIIINKP